MQKTVQEIMDMITNGKLHCNQSTQRKFIYCDMEAQLSCGKTTKSGSLINAILENHIQLPALYFWYNTDTNQLNIHDGKQRILSLYYFINPTAITSISTIRNGRETSWNGLSEEDQNYILNYKFDIVERSGTSAEEEVSFDLINSNSVPLTPYECLSGMFYGTFLKDFETYVDTLSNSLDNIRKIGRGEQAYKILLTCFNIIADKQIATNSVSNLKLKDALRPIRYNAFIASDYALDKILFLFNDLMKTIKGLKEERGLAIANYIVRSNYDADKIVTYYRECVRLVNDISSWDIATHKTFINKFIQEGLRLCPQRNFSKDVKDLLYNRNACCAYVDPETGKKCSETSYSRLEVDHILPWASGGRTVIDNAQLLCKHHNTSKGNKI